MKDLSYEPIVHVPNVSKAAARVHREQQQMNAEALRSKSVDSALIEKQKKSRQQDGDGGMLTDRDRERITSPIRDTHRRPPSSAITMSSRSALSSAGAAMAAAMVGVGIPGANVTGHTNITSTTRGGGASSGHKWLLPSVASFSDATTRYHGILSAVEGVDTKTASFVNYARTMLAENGVQQVISRATPPSVRVDEIIFASA